MKFLKHRMPKNDWGDRIVSFYLFVTTLKRFPSKHKKLFNDELYRLKLSDEISDPLRIFVSDKEYVKIYVREKLGDCYNVPTDAVLHTSAEVDTFNFPPNCCIKGTHFSGAVIFSGDGKAIDRDKIKAWMRRNFYAFGRERNYKYLKRKIIIEPLVFGTQNPTDYKFFCYNGEPKFLQADFDRHTDHCRIMYNLNWEPQPFTIRYPVSDRLYPKPANFDQMIAAARALSADFKGFLRVDMYSDGQDIKIGELTNVPGNAIGIFTPDDGEKLASQLLFA